MKIAACLFFLLPLCALGQTQQKSTLRSILLEQLHTTHNTKDWFVMPTTAVAGLTPEQANWKDASGNHSIGQLAYHLVFWNQQSLAKFKAKIRPSSVAITRKPSPILTRSSGPRTVKQLDQIMTDWEKAVEAADDKKLEASAPPSLMLELTTLTTSGRSSTSQTARLVGSGEGREVIDGRN